MDRGAWRAAVHGVIEGRTGLSTQAHMDVMFGLLQCRVEPPDSLHSVFLLMSKSDGHLSVLWLLHMYIRTPPFTHIIIRMHTHCLT